MSSIGDLILDQYFELSRRFHAWKTRPKYIRIGNRVCCCDGKHRMIVAIETDTVVTMDGTVFSVPQCVEQITSNGDCHTKYEL